MRLLRLTMVLLAISVCTWKGWGQTYSASPATTSCVSQGSLQAGSTTYALGYTKMAASFSGNTVTITLSHCGDGRTFPAGTSIQLRESTSNSLSSVLQGSTVKTVTISSISSSFSFTYTLPFSSGTRYYSVVSPAGNTELCTEVMGITASSGPVGNPPTCSVTGVTNITAHSATLSGQVNPNGTNTSYLFQYATNSSFPTNSTGNSSATVAGSGNGNVTVSAQVSNLAENTRYYYRIMALNSNGTTTSSYSTFDTPYDIQLNASMGIPASMSVGQSYNISIKVLNNSLEQFRGCFYLKDGNTNVLDWSNVTINTMGVYTLEKSYTPTSTGTKYLTLFHQSNCSGNGVEVDGRNYSNPVTVTITQANQAPSQPSNPSPANNATGIGLNPTFSWNSVDPDGDQVYYKLMLSTIENSLPVEKQGTGTSTTSPYTLQAGVTYYWRIESYDSQGKTSIGPTWRFTTAGPTINPVLSLSTTSVVLGNSLTVSGSSFTENNQVQLIFSRANGTQFLSTYVGTISSGGFTYNYATTETGTITVTATDVASGQQRSTSFSVTNPQPTLSVSRNSVNFPAVGGLDSIEILSSNVNWSVNKSDSWITIDKTSGSGYGHIIITVPQNTSTNQLSGTITVSGSGVASQIVNITQLGAVAPTYYTVTFNANGGSPTPSSQSIVSGGKVTQPQTPARSGYTFDGWYDGSHLWNFAYDTVYYHLTLSAQWTQTTPANRPPTIGANPVNPANGATNVEYASVTLQWSASDPDNNIGGFDLYYRPENGSWNSEALHAVNGLFDRRTLTNLQPGTKYFWKVMVWDTSDANSGWSNDWSFTTKAAVPTVTTPVITTTSLPVGTVNVAYNVTLAATGGGTITWKNSGSLPPGLSIQGANISGTPTTKGTYNFNLIAENSAGVSNAKNFTIVIEDNVIPVQRINIVSWKDPEAGNTGELVVEIVPANATNKNINWVSSDPSIATVSPTTSSNMRTTITGIREGTVKITANSAENANISNFVNVTVKPAPSTTVTPDIRMASNINGIPQTVTVGQNITFNATVKNYNTTTDWNIAFFLKDEDNNDIWKGLGDFVKLNKDGSYTIQSNNTFQVPNYKTGRRTWTLYYWIQGTQGGDIVRSQGSYSNQVTVQVNPATTLSSDATLKSLTVSQGSLSPSFSPSNEMYEVSVANTASSITITATANDMNAKLEGDFNKSLNLNVGLNRFSITVTAQNGTKKVYTIHVTKASQPNISLSYYISNNSVFLTWGSVQGAVSYQLYRNSILKVGAPNISVSAGNFLGVDNPPAGHYTYHVEAITTTGQKINSNTVEVSLGTTNTDTRPGGSLFIQVIDRESGEPVENVTIFLPHEPRSTTFTGSTIIKGVPYGTQGKIEIYKEGYLKFQKKVGNSYYDDINYEVSEKNPEVTIIITGTLDKSKPSAQTYDLQLETPIDTKSPIVPGASLLFNNIRVRNISGKVWSGKIYFLQDNWGITGTAGSVEKRERSQVVELVNIPINGYVDRNISFLPGELSGKNNTFLFISEKQGETQQKKIIPSSSSIQNPITLSFQNIDFKTKYEDIEEALNVFGTKAKAVGFLTSDKILKTIGAAIQKEIKNIDSGFETMLYSLSDYLEKQKNELNGDNPQSWIEIMSLIDDVAGDGIFSSYFDIGKGLLNQIDGYVKTLNNAGLVYKAFESGFDYYLKINVKGKDPGSVANQIASVRLNYEYITTIGVVTHPKPDNLSHVEKATYKINANNHTGEGSTNKRGGFEIFWKNGKITFVPFQMALGGFSDGLWDSIYKTNIFVINLESKSGGDDSNMADIIYIK